MGDAAWNLWLNGKLQEKGLQNEPSSLQVSEDPFFGNALKLDFRCFVWFINFIVGCAIFVFLFGSGLGMNMATSPSIKGLQNRFEKTDGDYSSIFDDGL